MMTTKPSEILAALPLHTPTPDAWTKVVLGSLSEFIADHASCERKAHAAAMMLVNRFPEHPDLQDMMIQLAHEELDHFQQVLRILRGRNLTVHNDEVDLYVKKLLTHVRHPRREHLLDRLLVVALVEARSCERFCLLAIALPEGPLKDFYTTFAADEGRHVPLFVNAAKSLYPADEVEHRLDELLAVESRIMNDLPLRPAVH
jgi:tRNA-(ms[2]io[6]A)-hydroxylase